MKYFEYRHVVTLQDTNLVGNVYFVNYLTWQGHCRELFLRQHAPGVLEQLGRGLALATVRCSCEYFAELEAFDEVIIRMRLDELTLSRIALTFDYYRRAGVEELQLVARGQQQIACMQRMPNGIAQPAPVPDTLRTALEPYAIKEYV